jgi:hypothetical protein
MNWKWTGSSDVDDKSGTADFAVDGEHYVIRLEKFADAQAIERMLEVSFQQGKAVAARMVFVAAKEEARRIGASV